MKMNTLSFHGGKSEVEGRSRPVSSFEVVSDLGVRTSDSHRTELSRRDFLVKSAVAISGLTLPSLVPHQACAAEFAQLPIVVFSKIYQELKLNFEEAAALTADAGLDGVDCPVRPGGEIQPERVEEDLPRYIEVLKNRKLSLPLLTTAITSPATPHAERVLRAAKKLGIKYYRLGAFSQKEGTFERRVTEIKAMFKDLAALNKQVGITGLFQNHTGSIGADLAESRQLLDGLDPEALGLAFDLGHAIIAHGDAWREHFEALKRHLKVAYVKDVVHGKGWVPFGQGQFAQTGYFRMLRRMGYDAPFSLHIEFDWSDKGENKTRGALLKALKQSTGALRGWLKEA
jgi:sugar phosphate isomerase/epimerase